MFIHLPGMDAGVSLLAGLGSLLHLQLSMGSARAPLMGPLLSQILLNLTGLFPLFHKLTQLWVCLECLALQGPRRCQLKPRTIFDLLLCFFLFSCK